MLVISLFPYLILFSFGELHQVVKNAHHQTIDFCNHKANPIMVLIFNFGFVLLCLMEGTGRICEMTRDFLKALLM